MKRIIVQDKYNDIKTWEVTKLSRSFYLKQFIARKQFGSGIRITKKWTERILEIKIKFEKGEKIRNKIVDPNYINKKRLQKLL